MSNMARPGQGRRIKNRVKETLKERGERLKAERLAQIKQDVEDGTLVIRKMTPEEREKFPPRKPLKKRAV